jgi:hypothetical protein
VGIKDHYTEAITSASAKSTATAKAKEQRMKIFGIELNRI